MVRIRCVAAGVIFLLALPVSAAAVSPVGGTAQRSAAQPVYLALGDSVAAGVGAGTREDGYVGQLTELLRSELSCAPGAEKAGGTCSQLSLVDLSAGGATTSTLISRQLPEALALLGDRNGDRNPRNDVRVITVTIGGNDIFQPVVSACIQQQAACAATVQQVLTQYLRNLSAILAQLRTAAGPETTIVTTAYYNPLPGCFLAPYAPLADVVLEGGTLADVGTLALGMNDLTRLVTAGVDGEVAELFGALAVEDLVGGTDCLHPDLSGHTIIAGIFADTIV